MNLKKLFSNRREEAPFPVVEVAVAPPPPPLKPKRSIAEKIQREMVDRQDALFRQIEELAKQQVPEDDPEIIRAKRLQALGFGAQPSVEKMKTAEMLAQKAANDRELQRKGAAVFPGLKYISEDVMQVVCRKYNLVLGDVGDFNGEIPDWALDQIERCNPRIGTVYTESSFFSAYGVEARDKYAKAVADPRLFTTMSRSQFGSLMHYRTSNPEVAKEYGAEMLPAPLMIAAPTHEMIVRRGMVLVNGRIVPDPTIQDPIVCVEVPGGFAVVCAWGEEGSDPGVFNAESN